MTQLLEEEKANRARAKIHRLIKVGTLIRPSICEKCGKEGYIIAHHDDYNKPLEVRWLCASCHQKPDTPNHKIPEWGKGGNRPKTERNQKIWNYWQKGYRQSSIAKIFHMKVSAVSMVILREQRRRGDAEDTL